MEVLDGCRVSELENKFAFKGEFLYFCATNMDDGGEFGPLHSYKPLCICTLQSLIKEIIINNNNRK